MEIVKKVCLNILNKNIDLTNSLSFKCIAALVVWAKMVSDSCQIFKQLSVVQLLSDFQLSQKGDV